MTIILGILKIILIVLLVLLITVCILAALILFAPVRYHVNGSFIGETPDARAELRWLHGVLSVKAAYIKGEGLEAYVNAFGHKIYDILGDDDDAEADADANAYAYTNEGAGTGKQKTVKLGDNNASSDRCKPQISVYSSNPLLRFILKIKEAVQDKLACLKRIPDRISSIIDAAEAKLRDILGRLIETAAEIKEAFIKRSTQLKELKALWDDKHFAACKALLLDRIVKLLLELKPRSGSGYIRIGREDPYSTGQAMQLAAFLYPFYADTIEVIPDFDQSILEGKLDIGGRVRLIVPAEAALRVFFNKELRIMYKKARHILELE